MHMHSRLDWLAAISACMYAGNSYAVCAFLMYINERIINSAYLCLRISSHSVVAVVFTCTIEIKHSENVTHMKRL